MTTTFWTTLSLFSDQYKRAGQAFRVHPWTLPPRRGAVPSDVMGLPLEAAILSIM